MMPPGGNARGIADAGDRDGLAPVLRCAVTELAPRIAAPALNRAVINNGARVR